MNAAVRTSKRWTLRVCAGCASPRLMPASEAICRRCEPRGGLRSWRLLGLRERRLLEELSPEALADLAGISPATVRRAERGRVRTETTVVIAEALGTSVRELKETERKE